jgi:hypothetical protein
MTARTSPIRFRFSIARRPDYYRALADRYSQYCKSQGGQALALARQDQGAHLQVWVQCAEEHRFWVAGRHLIQGTWCPDCRKTDHRSDALQQMKALAVKRRGKLLSTAYVNARTPLDWKCEHGHKWSATADNVSNKGSWCPECALQELFAARDRAHRRRKR